ncbi:MAG: S8 family serine peptidase [Verrucomicrobiota bacterium]
MAKDHLVQVVGADGVVLTTDAPGPSQDHLVEIYSVNDVPNAIEAMATTDGVAWVSPVLVGAESGLRVLVSDEIVVALTDDADAEAMAKEFNARGFEIAEYPRALGPAQYLLRRPGPKTIELLGEANALMDLPGVAWAEPNFIFEVALYSVPNDTFFGRQQGLHNVGQNSAVSDADVDAPEAWDIRTGNEQLIIAILDTGVDTGHPDLKIFTNPNEYGDGRESNGVDNDGNGYIDDYQGWDFYGYDNNPNHGTSSAAAHGTACAGIAAAQAGNSVGVAGAARGCRILPVKITDDGGASFTTTFQLGKAIRYAAQSADVISCSWGGMPESSAISAAIDFATTSGRGGKGCGVFFAAGNGASCWDPKPRRIRVTIPASGNYRFAFRYISNGLIDQQAAIDQVRLLHQNNYDHLWHEDFETGTAPGWTLAKSSSAIGDWWLSDGSGIYHWFQRPGSQWCYAIPTYTPVAGEWSELQTPELNLSQGNYILSYLNEFATDGVASATFEVWVLDPSGGRTILSTGITKGPCDGAMSYPARYANSIAIGAASDIDKRSYYSDYISAYGQLFAVAPSNGGWNDVVTTDTRGASGRNSGDWNGDGDYTMDFGGTSAATPLAAGVAALVLSKNASLTLFQIKDLLRQGCDHIGGVTYDGNGWHQEYGYGRLNAQSSVLLTPSDAIAPTLSSVVARSGRAVEVTFSEQMGDGVTTPGNYTISGSGKGTLPANPASVSWLSGNKYVLEWTSGEMISGTGNITITVSSTVKDVAGNGVGSPNSGTTNGSRVIHQVNCGTHYSSFAIYPFETERYWSGAGNPSGLSTVNSVINNDGTPTDVYGTERIVLTSTSYPGDIVFTVPNITSGVNHAVRLYFFANGYSHYAGDVVFDVYINNVLKLSDFDLNSQAGGIGVGLWREFTNITASGGSISVRIIPNQTWNRTWGAYYYNATISGIKVTAQ